MFEGHQSKVVGVDCYWKKEIVNKEGDGGWVTGERNTQTRRMAVKPGREKGAQRGG